VVINGFAVTATVIVWVPLLEPDDELFGFEHALAVAARSAAAAAAAGQTRR
jgi:hypothetical protein